MQPRLLIFTWKLAKLRLHRPNSQTDLHTQKQKVINWASVLHKQWIFLNDNTVDLLWHCTALPGDLHAVCIQQSSKSDKFFFFLVFPCSMPRHHQPFKSSGLQRRPLPKHGEDLQQLHCGPGESGGHLHGEPPWPVLPQGKGCILLIVRAKQAQNRSDVRRLSTAPIASVQIIKITEEWTHSHGWFGVFVTLWLELCLNSSCNDKVVNTGQMWWGTTHTYIQACTQAEINYSRYHAVVPRM